MNTKITKIRTIADVIEDIKNGTWSSDTEYQSECEKLYELCDEILEISKVNEVKGDLISKSVFIKSLNDYVANAYNCGGIDDENVIEYQQTYNDKSAYIIQGFNEVYELLENQPTAYDVSKVVAELEEKAQDYHDRRVHHKTIGNLDNAVAFGHKEDAVRKSILIVRKGGVK